MFRKYLQLDSPYNFLSLNWIKKIEGVIRVVIFDSQTKDSFVVSYQEQKNKYAIHAFNCTSAQTYWEKEVTQGGYGAPAVLNDLFICPTKFTDIIALSKRDGSTRWSFTTSQRVRSSINIMNDRIYFSSGGTIYELDAFGKLITKWTLDGAFFFGPVDIVNELIISLATLEDEKGNSTIKAFAFMRKGDLAYSTFISNGPVISSDTCGIAWQNGYGFVGGSDTIVCFDSLDGNIIWNSKVNGFAGRQTCTIKGKKVFYTTLNGVIGSLNTSDGSSIWEIKTSDKTIVSPISILNNNLIVVADAHLNVLSSQTGQLLQKLPIGHSPYSMISLNGQYGLIGSGEPPHNGLLFCFDITNEIDEKYSCSIYSSNCFIEEKFCDILMHVCNIAEDIDCLSLDGSLFHSPAIEGKKITPALYTFRIPLSRSVCPSDYIVMLKIMTSAGRHIFRPVTLSFKRGHPLPEKAHLSFISPFTQEKPNYSGAAIAQALKKIYDNKNVSQTAIREMVDASRSLGNYEPHDNWRIILRRILTSSATSKAELTEFNAKKSE